MLHVSPNGPAMMFPSPWRALTRQPLPKYRPQRQATSRVMRVPAGAANVHEADVKNGAVRCATTDPPNSAVPQPVTSSEFASSARAVQARFAPPAPGAPQLTTSYVPAFAGAASARLPSSIPTAIQPLIGGERSAASG